MKTTKTLQMKTTKTQILPLPAVAQVSQVQVNFTVDDLTFSMKKTEFSQPIFLKGPWKAGEDEYITLTDKYEFEALFDGSTVSCSGTWDASYTERDGEYSGILRTVTEFINEGSGFSLGGASPYELLDLNGFANELCRFQSIKNLT